MHMHVVIYRSYAQWQITSCILGLTLHLPVLLPKTNIHNFNCASESSFFDFNRIPLLLKSIPQEIHDLPVSLPTIKSCLSL